MKVRIIQSDKKSSWYFEKIGEIFEVEICAEDGLYVVAEDVGKAIERLIGVEDCEIVRSSGSYERLATEIGALVDTKQAQYGDAITKVGDVLAIMYPDGIKPEQYVGMGLTVRVLDKLFRVANGDQGEESAWSDVAGYGLLGAMMRKGNE